MDDVQVVAPLRVVTLRHLPGAQARVDSVLAALTGPPLQRPEPGCFNGRPGDGACLLWLRPNETLCIATADAVPDALLRELAPGAQPLACALDVSSAWFGLALHGAAGAAVLPRLVDASAIPTQAGRGTRARLADVAALVLRLDDACTWLLVDRSHRPHLLEWIAHARAGGA